MKAIGYASLSGSFDADDGMTIAEQEAAIARRTTANGWTLTGVQRDVGPCDIDTLPSRVGLGAVLDAIRDERACALVVARLDRLSLDVLVQELILASLGRMGATLTSATGSDEAEIADPPARSERALVRRAIRSVPEYERAVRDLRVRFRLGRTPSDEDREQAALSRIEQLSEHGATPEQISRALTDEGFSPHFSRVWNRAGLQALVEQIRTRHRR